MGERGLDGKKCGQVEIRRSDGAVQLNEGELNLE